MDAAMIYRPGDLGAIAALMPEAALSAKHQAIVDIAEAGGLPEGSGNPGAGRRRLKLMDF